MPIQALRFVNLVFQGGGVKGLAYAGLIAQMPPHLVVKGVGGTSAGAIAAALLAVGKNSGEMREIFTEMNCDRVLGPNSKNDLDDFRHFLAATRDQFASGWPGFLKSASFCLRNKKTLNMIAQRLWASKGLFPTDSLRQWLQGHLGSKTFEEVYAKGAGVDLRIVAANVSTGEFKVFDWKQNGSTPIVDAVVASASIPVFFEPSKWGGHLYVDGGLLSNFPSYLFDGAPYPTIGIRLPEIQLDAAISTFGQFLMRNVATMTEAHDRARKQPERFSAYTVDFSEKNVAAIDFDLTGPVKTTLYQDGVIKGQKVKWDEDSATNAAARREPGAEDMLARTMGHALRYFDEVRKISTPAKLDEKSEFHVWIRKDWSTQYENVSTFKVTGPVPLVMARHKISFAAESPNWTEGGQSILHPGFTYREWANDHWEEKPVVIPAINDPLTKGFLVLYAPPVAEDSGPRVFQVRWNDPKEFSTTIAVGKVGIIGTTKTARAGVHELDIEFKIFVSIDLPQLTINMVSGRPLQRQVKVTENEGEFYYEYVGRENVSLKADGPNFVYKASLQL